MDFIRHPSRRRDVYGLKLGTRGALDQPHWRTPAVGLGVQFLYRATGEKQWRDHFLTASRNFLKVNPTNWWGKRLMAQAYVATREAKYLRALQGLLRGESGRTTYGWVSVLVQGRSPKVPDDLAKLSFAELTQLFRRQGFSDPRSVFYGGRYWPYALRALAEAGLGEEALLIRKTSRR